MEIRRAAGMVLLLAVFSCQQQGSGELVAKWPYQVPADSYTADQSAVYARAWTSWPNLNTGEILLVPLSGGSPAVVSPTVCATRLLLANDEIICSQSGLAMGPGAIVAVPKSGGTSRTVVPDQQGVVALASDGTSLFWTTWTDSGVPGSQSQTIKSASLAGGSVTTLLTVTGDVPIPRDIAVDAAHVYFLQSSASAGVGLFSMSKQGTEIVNLDPDASSCCILWNPPLLYWFSRGWIHARDPDSGVVHDVARATQPFILFRSDDAGVVAILAGCRQSEHEDGPEYCSSSMIDLRSGEQMAFAEASLGPYEPWWTSVAMDRDYVYWSPGGWEHRRVRRNRSQ